MTAPKWGGRKARAWTAAVPAGSTNGLLIRWLWVQVPQGAPFCSPQRKAAGWRCAAPCADAECVPEDGGTAVMGDGQVTP
jgi:hypothetical protein